MRRYPNRSLLRAVAPLIVAGTFTVAATAAAAGLQPAGPSPIPDSAFAPVRLPAAALGSSGVPGDMPGPGAGALVARLSLEPRVERSLTADTLAALAQDSPERARPKLRAPDRIVVDIAPPKPAVVGGSASTSHVLRGAASWYCRAGVSPCTYTHPDGGGFDAYAAAGPKLRAAIGPGWRGMVISVDGISVKLIDWCQCYQGEPHEKLLDLYYDVYRRTGGSVTIRW